MKLTGILLLTGLLQVQARGIAQSVTYTAHGVPLTKVFAEIKRQTGYLFFYSPDDLKESRPVTCEWKNLSLLSALDNLFAGQPLAFEVQGNTVVVSKAERTPVIMATAPPPPNDIHGRVTDSLGNPLVGASVTVKGSRRGVQTDDKGEFFLKGAEDNAILVITYSGFESRIVKYNGQTALQIVLPRSNSQLDQVQVIAYGTTSERYSTGNVTTVTGKEIEKQPVDNPLLALEGRVPGLLVTQANGLSGSGVTVRVQGQNSIQNGNDPLYVIDGVPYLSQMLPTTTGGPLGSSGGAVFGLVAPGGGNPMSYINPGDIESITVLKDADATAIYGSRAANGAILIITKSGKPGQTRFTIDLQDGDGKVTRKMKLLNTQQYLQMRHEALTNDGLQPDTTSDFDLTLWDTTRYTNWQKTLIGGTAHYNNINATLSGGTDNTQYLIGGTFHRETTVFPGDFSDQKGSVHFSLTSASTNRKFHVQLSANYLTDNNQLPSSDYTNVALSMAPDAPKLYNADGSINWEPSGSGTSTFYNPIASVFHTYNLKSNNLISNVVFRYEVAPGLELKSSLGYNNLQANEFSASPLIAVMPENQATSLRTARYSNSNNNSWIVEPQITYEKKFRVGKFNLLAGTTFEQNNSNGTVLAASGYNSDAVLEDIRSATSVNVTSTTQAVYKYSAVFGRINWSLDDKYILDFTARRDGSSRFGSDNELHDFASAGAAWIFSQEDLLKRNLPFLSFGKLRASYGTTGNDQIGDYQYLNLYKPISVGNPYENIPSLQVNSLPNPHLQWELTKKLQFGVDLGFLKDRILVTANYAINRSSNELLQYSLPLITGFNSITSNFPATVQNSDWEISLNTINVKGKQFTWSSRINLTVPKNKLVAFPNLASSSYAAILLVGQPVSVVKVLNFLGADPVTGIYKFSSKTDPFNPVMPDDQTVLVNTTPKYYGGFENTFTYKGFSLDVFLQFVKQLGANDLYTFNPVPGQFNSGFSNQPATVLKRWQRPGEITNIQKYNSDGSLFLSEYYAMESNAGYSDASFIRLKNLSFAYELPNRWKNKSKLKTCQVYLQGQNLLTITKYIGLDPETRSSTTLPPLKILTLGLKVGI